MMSADARQLSGIVYLSSPDLAGCIRGHSIEAHVVMLTGEKAGSAGLRHIAQTETITQLFFRRNSFDRARERVGNPIFNRVSDHVNQ